MTNLLGSKWSKIGKLLDYLAVIYFVVSTPGLCATGTLPPPRNLSYVWEDTFSINATWQVPEFKSSCILKYVFRGPNKVPITTPDFFMTFLVAELDSDMKFSVSTTTNKMGPCSHYQNSPEVSLAVLLQRKLPLVTDFKFFRYPECGVHAQLPFCGFQATWIPANGTAGLQVSYRACGQSSASKMVSCNITGNGGGGRSQGCPLTVLTTMEDACIRFRGTVDGKEEIQSFRRITTNHLNYLPPACHVTEQAGHLNVSWRHYGVGSGGDWSYEVNYSECDKRKEPVKTDPGANHKILPFKKSCRYEVWVKSMYKGPGTDWARKSECCVYDATRDQTQDQLVVLAFVAIPGIFSILVVVACSYIRRQRKTLFKNIPVPPSSLKGMMSSIHQSQQLFVPAPEETQVCRVSLKPGQEVDPLWMVS